MNHSFVGRPLLTCMKRSHQYMARLFAEQVSAFQTYLSLESYPTQAYGELPAEQVFASQLFALHPLSGISISNASLLCR